ncbi:type VI secretion system tip protein TssI/VgrG [Pseudomonas sp. RIT411]|uniref:type VI secretion system Vgr family protein n=1 Tax=Pseudomonas sp. RIT411 TaxID=2202160 RepID=UPI000D3BFA50|nr:type VI secretion system tip protein TssI/VgrG [Pseudomonas sp. RIT 411]RAU40443.1 type VI secretion system tip protein VgrG [Pseudomonas sp. RIT 411]
MFSPANAPRFTLTLPGLPHDFQVLAFHGQEALNEPYRLQVEVVSEKPDWALEDLLNRPAWLGLGPMDVGLHGLLGAIVQGDSGRRLTRYRLELVPRLTYLAQRTNSRIFQNLAVPQILARLLEEHGILEGAYRLALGPTPYPARDYCVQYGESDLHFLNRLCEEEGIHYHFEHRPDGAVLVFGDDATSFPRLAATPYHPGSGQVADHPVVRGLEVGVQTRSTQLILRDQDPLQPRLRLESRTDLEQQPTLESYRFPAGFRDRNRGKQLSARGLEALRVDSQTAQGHGDQPRLASGHFLPLTEHPRASWNQLWLLTRIEHQGHQPQVLEEGLGTPALLGLPDYDGWSQGYRNRFHAIPWQLPFRPLPRHPKPRLLGQQSAVVTGPAGEEIHCDALGRVKVQFHWDREGQADERTSCWLRVASNWAGNRQGALAIPRVGMEVLVGFLEGDPDQPLILGCLYHAEHQPPVQLPRDKTRSTFKSLSSPGGQGYNELRIEDRQGQEEIHVHAQRDWDEHIRHDHRSEIGHERYQRIHGNSHSELHAEEHRLVHSLRKVEVKASDHLLIGGSQHLKLGSGQFVEAGQEIHIKAGDRVVIEAGTELTLTAGGSFIKLEPSGITLVGPLARLNAGGAPGKGSGIALQRPRAPGTTQPGTAGDSNQLALANEPQHQDARPQRMLHFSV